jgi:signal recognition particle GTPase
MESLLKHIPDMHNVEVSASANNKVKQMEAIIYSMTTKEPTHPNIIDPSWRHLIAKG